MLLKQTERYAVLQCTVDDIAATMSFFGDEHDPAHPLAASRRYTDWYYFDPGTQRYNIIIAKDNNDAVLGLLAYTTNIFFDKRLPRERKFVWLTNWLAKRAYKGFVGLELMNALDGCEGCSNVGVLGLTKNAEAFYGQTGYSVGSLRQYFYANASLDSFKVLQGYSHASRTKPPRGAQAKARLIRLDCLSGLKTQPVSAYIEASAPYKSLEYFENKYLKNPFYDYFAYGLEHDGIVSVIIGRVLGHNGANVVRLVDYAGDGECLAGLAPQDILDRHDAEYLDFYCAGIPEAVLFDAGFSLNTGENGLVVPNYFEPFKNENVSIKYAYKPSAHYVFKGDGDRDYPRCYDAAGYGPPR